MQVQINKAKIFIIIGPTASGKSDAAVDLAQKINGEVVSADSRQIYKDLDVGSGKITKEEMQNVPHHCLDIFEAGETKSVTDYLMQADKAIQDILSRNKVPIICGGTGLYIDAILYGIPENAKPNPLLRLELEKYNCDDLLEKIKALSEEKWCELTNSEDKSERNNKRRLIRILEILTSKSVEDSESKSISPLNKEIKYDAEFIFIGKSKEELQERIKLRLGKRLKKYNPPAPLSGGTNSVEETFENKDLVSEIRYLIEEKKVNPDWLISLGLEYKYATLYYQGKISKEEMIKEIQNKSWQYAKRQMLWNRRYGN